MTNLQIRISVKPYLQDNYLDKNRYQSTYIYIDKANYEEITQNQ